MTADRQLVHATAIAIDGRAALIVGLPGSGKSDLALRLITTAFHDGGRPLLAQLIADDQVVLQRRGHRLIASAPEAIAGLLEVRGLGIMPFAHVVGIEVGIVVDLDQAGIAVRYPDPPEFWTLLGVDVRLVRIDPRHASAPAKLVIASLRLGGA